MLKTVKSRISSSSWRDAGKNGSLLLNMLLGQRVNAGSHNATRGVKFFLFSKWHDIIARWKDILHRKKKQFSRLLYALMVASDDINSLAYFSCLKLTGIYPKMDQITNALQPCKQFAKDSMRLVKRCTKPDRKGI